MNINEKQVGMMRLLLRATVGLAGGLAIGAAALAGDPVRAFLIVLVLVVGLAAMNERRLGNR